MEEVTSTESDAADVSEASMINQFVICDHCKLLIPAADNLGEHVCESAAAADVIKTEADLVVESSVSGYRCDYCHKTFSQPSNLKRHERTHSGERPFVCNVCNRSFAQCSNLKTHFRLHTGQRPYVCTQCGRSFTQSSNLYKHMRSHDATNDWTRRRFICMLCGRGFADNNVLTMHFRIHSGERPFGCDLCGRSFSQESNLRRHMRTHTGERPYVCVVCNRSFTQSNNLKAHMTLHAKTVDTADDAGRTVVIWPCDLCDAQFTHRSELDQHRASHDIQRIVVVTPSSLRLTAHQVMMNGAGDTTTPSDSADDGLVCVNSTPSTDN